MSRIKPGKTEKILPVLGKIWGIWQIQSNQNLGLIAAGIAFYGLLSLFPGITAAVALGGVFLRQEMLVENSAEIADILPQAAETIIMDQLRSVAATDEYSLSFAALVASAITLYSASRAVGNFIAGLNVIHQTTESRGFFKLKALTILFTVLILVGLILGVIVVAAIPVIAALFSPLGWLADLVLLLRWPVLFLMAAVGITLLYRFGPDRKDRPKRWLTTGALAACALWVAGSFGFSSYVQSFGSYNETFGALGGVIILLTWLWLSAFIVLMGALFDVELAKSESKRKHQRAVADATAAE